MKYFIILLTAVIAVTFGIAGTVRNLKCPDTGDICAVNSTCEFNCTYSCCNKKGNFFVAGSVIYSSDSSICRAALHDLRISLHNSKAREVHISRFQKDNCSLESSVRFGFSTSSFKNELCSLFKFISPRVSEDILDVVSMHTNYLYGQNETHTQVCIAASNAVNQSVVFGIYSEWMNCDRKKREGTEYGSAIKFERVWDDESGAAGFQCIPSKTDLSIVTSIAFQRDASFLPEQLSITINKYENVTLTMNEIAKELQRETIWRKDGEIVIENERTRTSLSLVSVHESSSGIYSLSYNNSDRKESGFIQLIVRACPIQKFGDDCSKNCPLCLNGGICHDITGECLCAPGFNGSLCETACQPGYVGKLCNIKCDGEISSGDELCKGLLICLPRPYGCSCASGFNGLQCDKACPDGTYGAGCKQHHKHVQQKKDTCSKYFDSCECLSGWHGVYCNESYPVLSSAPSLLYATENSITLSFTKWSNSTDVGLGVPASYEVVYKEINGENWTRVRVPSKSEKQLYQVKIKNLKPATHYTVAVVVVDESENKQETDLKTTNVSTACDIPSAPPSDIQLSSANQHIYVTWKLPSRDMWNCWEIIISVKAKEISSNVLTECIKDDIFSCSFYSDPLDSWIIYVCISSNGTAENCAKPKNITANESSFSSPVELEIIKKETSLSLSWVSPRFFSKLDVYVIIYEDVDTNISRSITVPIEDAVCEANNTNYQCYTIQNLIPGHVYKIEIIAYLKNIKEGNLIKSFIVSLEKVPVATPVIVGVSVPLLLICCIIALILFLQRRNKVKSSLKVKFLPYKLESEFASCNEALDEMEIIETESMCEEISNPIHLSELSEYVKESLQNVKIRKEFMSVPTGQIYPCNIAKLGDNKPKNRYGNILPYDHSRVILDTVDGDPFSNYIHASYIHGYSNVKKYIATQGPLQNTVNDFWRMVWNEGSCKILMITNFVENGKMPYRCSAVGCRGNYTNGPRVSVFKFPDDPDVKKKWIHFLKRVDFTVTKNSRLKCEKYWNESSCMYGDIEVSFVDSKSYADYITRKFELRKNNTSRELQQFHFTTWPDHGAPFNATPFINYLKKARCYKPDSETPIIVHCSAGIGRTGATILLDSMLDMGLQEKKVDLVGHLCSMRKQRMNIVENFDQYVFVYYALVESFCFEDTYIKCTDFRKEFEKLKLIDKMTEMIYIEKQFKALERLNMQLMSKDVQGAYHMENQNKNRSMLILPPDRGRPFLSRDSSSTGYINAVYVDSFTVKNAYIATQYPLPGTVGDFWSMVFEQKSKVVVVLQEMDFTVEGTPQLWSPEGVQTFGEFEVILESVASDDEMTVANVTLFENITQVNKEPISVNIIVLKNWSFDSNLPTGVSVVLSAILKVTSLNSETRTVITTVCSDGATACGIFCASLYICDQIKAEEVVDIFQAVKCIRTHRPQFIMNLAQYEFLFEVISSYLDSYEA